MRPRESFGGEIGENVRQNRTVAIQPDGPPLRLGGGGQVGMGDAACEEWQFLAEEAAALGDDHVRGAVGSGVMLPSGAVKASAADMARLLLTEINGGLSPDGRPAVCRVVP